MRLFRMDFVVMNIWKLFMCYKWFSFLRSLEIESQLLSLVFLCFRICVDAICRALALDTSWAYGLNVNIAVEKYLQLLFLYLCKLIWEMWFAIKVRSRKIFMSWPLNKISIRHLNSVRNNIEPKKRLIELI